MKKWFCFDNDLWNDNGTYASKIDPSTYLIQSLHNRQTIRSRMEATGLKLHYKIPSLCDRKGKNFQATTETSPPSYNPKFELSRAFTLIHPSTGGKHIPLVFKES